jgi:hypothetical protein
MQEELGLTFAIEGLWESGPHGETTGCDAN